MISIIAGKTGNYADNNFSQIKLNKIKWPTNIKHSARPITESLHHIRDLVKNTGILNRDKFFFFTFFFWFINQIPE